MALTEKLTAIADAIRVQSGKTDKLTLDQMPSEIVDLQSLGFEVVGGTSAPSNPKENTIWVYTDTEITGWQFASDDPNLLDFNAWANGIGVQSGTKTVSGNAITLTSNASGDCYTAHSADSLALIPCAPGKTYVIEWEWTGDPGLVFYFPSGNIPGCKNVNSSLGRFEFTTGVNENLFTFRIGVQAANATATYSNIRITEKERSFAPGAVWITTGISSEVTFNALKKNNITVYPMSVKQYVDGAWAVKNAQVYQSGTWKDMQYIIVPNTGTTWTKYAGTASASKTTSATTISITTKASANGTATNSAIYTEFDATQYSTFYVKGSYTFNNTTTSSQVYKIQLLNSSGSAISTIVNKTVSKGTNTGAVAFEKTIDLTSVTGKCKLMFTATTYTTESLTFATTISSCKAY